MDVHFYSYICVLYPFHYLSRILFRLSFKRAGLQVISYVMIFNSHPLHSKLKFLSTLNLNFYIYEVFSLVFSQAIIYSFIYLFGVIRTINTFIVCWYLLYYDMVRNRHVLFFKNAKSGPLKCYIHCMIAAFEESKSLPVIPKKTLLNVVCIIMQVPVLPRINDSWPLLLQN